MERINKNIGSVYFDQTKNGSLEMVNGRNVGGRDKSSWNDLFSVETCSNQATFRICDGAFRCILWEGVWPWYLEIGANRIAEQKEVLCCRESVGRFGGAHRADAISRMQRSCRVGPLLLHLLKQLPSFTFVFHWVLCSVVHSRTALLSRDFRMNDMNIQW